MDKVFIPRKIKVGYRKRNDTYTGKLAYVIYYDSKEKLRKETSWQNWRDSTIDFDDYDNEPLQGFVLNKKAGGYSTGWNHRQTYCRVYDPRDFEFEITIPNLLYILDNVNSIKGKGLEGEFVCGWQGSDLLLIPTDAPDYQELKAFSDTLYERKKFKGADLVSGGTYLNKKNEKVIYLGRFDLYENHLWREVRIENKGKHYFFVTLDGITKTYKYPGQGIVDIVSDDCAPNYAELTDNLEHKNSYSPHSHYEYPVLTDDEIERIKNSDYYCAYVKIGDQFYGIQLTPNEKNKTRYWYNAKNVNTYYDRVNKNQELSLEQLHQKMRFRKQVQVLQNGKIARS